MILIPAIDILEQQCVRLKEGKFNEKTVYFNNPVDAAKHWRDLGAKRLHVVDLDGARHATTTNFKIIEEIVQTMDKIPVQVGGGIRDFFSLDGYFNIGLSACILGTSAVTNKEFFIAAAKKYPEKIIAGLDANGDFLSISGWQEQSEINLFEYANWCAKVGAAQILYTDISRDGMLSGVNLSNLVKLAKSTTIPVIASGGVANLNDISTLLATNVNFFGVISGRALYNKSLDLAEANLFIENYLTKK